MHTCTCIEYLSETPVGKVAAAGGEMGRWVAGESSEHSQGGPCVLWEFSIMYYLDRIKINIKKYSVLLIMYLFMSTTKMWQRESHG